MKNKKGKIIEKQQHFEYVRNNNKNAYLCF